VALPCVVQAQLDAVGGAGHVQTGLFLVCPGSETAEGLPCSLTDSFLTSLEQLWEIRLSCLRVTYLFVVVLLLLLLLLFCLFVCF
jgi:hypothetical protein